MRQLFTQQQLKNLQHPKPKKPKKVWDIDDYMPFGRYKGQQLNVVAALSPETLTWWKEKNKIEFSPELTEQISLSKFIAQ